MTVRVNYVAQLRKADKVAEALRLDYTISRSELRSAALRYIDALGLDSVDLVTLVDVTFDDVEVSA